MCWQTVEMSGESLLLPVWISVGGGFTARGEFDVSEFFEISIFSQDIWGNVHYVPEIQLIS